MTDLLLICRFHVLLVNTEDLEMANGVGDIDVDLIVHHRPEVRTASSVMLESSNA